MSSIQAFNYEVTEFSFRGEPISTTFIRYMLIECLYESRTMSTLYMALHVPIELYQDIVNAEKTEEGYINLTIGTRNVFSDTSLTNTYISGKFCYILPSSSPDYSTNFTEEVDKSYKSIVLSLLDKDSLDKLKTSICGVYCEIDIQDLLRLALKGFKNVIVQPPTTEDLKKFETVVIPPMNNMKKMIDYLFNLKPFYNTAYTFFIDFNNAFLIAHDRETTAAIGAVSKIVFHVAGVTNPYAYAEGLVPGTNNKTSDYVEGDIYHIYLSPAEINVTPNKGIDLISNQIMSVEEDGMVTEPISLDYGIIGSEDSEFSKLAMRRGANINLFANILNSNTVTVELKKSHINGNIISPDKVISINFEIEGKDDFNQKYSGEYYITYKREYIKNSSGVFTESCNLGLKRIGNLSSVVDTSSSTTYANADTVGGSSRYSFGSRTSRTQKSAEIAAKTQSTVSRVSSNSSSTATALSKYSEAISNPYNLKSNVYTGPVAIDTNSSGAVNLLSPHILEKKL